ncbi:hypothetical protein HGRIS_001111 [Hohenbuehelia grisea]|uniref:Uncharacterized protein n=1 Tax=Hohenbuehelia grisea TaxID=104357 RepID=A0ABR3JNA9_9AGAR
MKRGRAVAGGFSKRVNRVGDVEDLETAIRHHTEALSIHSSGHPHRGSSLGNLAVALHTRYERVGDVEDLETAIRHHTEALSIHSSGHPDRGSSLGNLAGALSTRYKRVGDVEDLETAIRHHTEALSIHSSGHPDRGSSLGNLAVALSTRYKCVGDVEDLETAIRHHTETLLIRPSGHPDRGSSLDNLAVALHTRYKRVGDVEDLETAIRHHTEALSIHSSGHPDRGSSLGNLAVALSTRYERVGDVEDLETAIRHHTEAFTRYKRVRDVEDLETAIRHHTEALSICPSGHPDRGSSLNNLAVALRNRYERVGDVEDLETAIRHHTEALSIHSSGHPNHGSSLQNLAGALSARYKLLGHASDMNVAIQLCEMSLVHHAPGHPDRASSLAEFASSLWNTTTASSTPTLSRIFDLLREGSEDHIAPLTISLHCAQRWVYYAQKIQDDTQLTIAYTNIINFLRRYLTIGPTLKLQYASLFAAGLRTLPMDAAYHAIQTKNIEQAVEWLDSSRSLLWSEMRRFREELVQSEALGADLVNQFLSLCTDLQRLATAEVQYAPSVSVEKVINSQFQHSLDVPHYDIYPQKRKLLAEYDRLLAVIRTKSGLENFLGSMSFESLKTAAEEGPVIIIRAFSHRPQQPTKSNPIRLSRTHTRHNTLTRGVTHIYADSFYTRYIVFPLYIAPAPRSIPHRARPYTMIPRERAILLPTVPFLVFSIHLDISPPTYTCSLPSVATGSASRLSMCL